MSASSQIGARRATTDIAVQLVGRVVNLALGVVVTLVLARTLGSRGFGQWSTIFAIGQIAGNIGELGLSQVAIARAAGADSEPASAEHWLGALLTLRLLLAVPITALSILAICLLAPTTHALEAGVLISLVMLVSAPAALNAVFQLRVRNDMTIAVMTLNSVLWAGVVLVVAALAGGIVSFGLGLLCVTALTTGVTVVLARRLIPVRLRGSSKLWGALLRGGMGVGIAGILVTFYVRLDQVLVLEIAGSRAAGLYGAAYRILDQVQFVPASVMTTLFPLIAGAYPSNIERVRQLFKVTSDYLSMASLPILVFSIVAARPIMVLLFGSQFAASGPALPVLMAAFVSISFGYLVGNMVVILSLQRQFLRNAALALVINAVLNVIFIPRYGFMAAAWITLLTEVTVMSLTMRAVMLKLETRFLSPRLFRVLAAALLMGALAALGRWAGLPVLALAVISLLVYPAGLFGLGALRMAEVRAVLRKDVPLAR